MHLFGIARKTGVIRFVVDTEREIFDKQFDRDAVWNNKKKMKKMNLTPIRKIAKVNR